MGKNIFDLNSAGIYGLQNGKCKYYSNLKTNFVFVINMPDNLLVAIFMSCVEILTNLNLTKPNVSWLKLCYFQ